MYGRKIYMDNMNVVYHSDVDNLYYIETSYNDKFFYRVNRDNFNDFKIVIENINKYFEDKGLFIKVYKITNKIIRLVDNKDRPPFTYVNGRVFTLCDNINLEEYKII